MSDITDYMVVTTLGDGRIRATVTIPEDGTQFSFTGTSVSEVIGKWRKLDTWLTPEEVQ